MIMDTMLQNIPQRLHEVNTLLATCRQGVFSFGEALPLSLFYRDFSDTNLLVKEAVCLVKENPLKPIEFTVDGVEDWNQDEVEQTLDVPTTQSGN